MNDVHSAYQFSTEPTNSEVFAFRTDEMIYPSLTDPKPNNNAHYRCETCDVVCNGWMPYKQHLAGSHHRKRQNPAAAPSCSVCGLSFTSIAQCQAHLLGAKHKRAAKAATTKHLPLSVPSEAAAAVTATSPSDFTCSDCDLVCSSFDQLQEHYMGKRHARRCNTETGSIGESPVIRPSSSNWEDRILNLESSLPHCLRTSILARLPQCFTNHGNSSGSSKNEDIDNSQPFGMSSDASGLLERDKCATAQLSRDTDSRPDESGSQTYFCRHVACLHARVCQVYEELIRENCGQSAPKRCRRHSATVTAVDTETSSR